MSVPSQIGIDERLGRRISSQKDRKLVKRGDAPAKLFIRKGMRDLSVDRLREDWLADATDIAVRYDEGRGRKFYGWAAVSWNDATRNDREVEPSPQEGNQYHADIVLPQEVICDKNEYEKHAIKLAAQAHWQERWQPPAADE